MPAFLEHPVTDAWRTRVRAEMDRQDITVGDLAIETGTSRAAIYHVLTRARTSLLVAKIDAALASSAVRAPRAPHYDPALFAEIAVLWESRDAIGDDIKRLETARSAIEQRLVEAYQHHAEIEVKLSTLRARRPDVPAPQANSTTVYLATEKA